MASGVPNLYTIGAVASVGYSTDPPRALVRSTSCGSPSGLPSPRVRPARLYLVTALVGARRARVSLRRRGMVSAVLIAAIAGGLVGWIEAFVATAVWRGACPASAENTAGLHMALGLEARALVSPLCRPCTQPIIVTRDGGGSRYLHGRSRRRRRGQPPPSSPRRGAGVRGPLSVTVQSAMQHRAACCRYTRSRASPPRRVWTGSSASHPLVVAHALVGSRGRDACCSARQPAGDASRTCPCRSHPAAVHLGGGPFVSWAWGSLRSGRPYHRSIAFSAGCTDMPTITMPGSKEAAHRRCRRARPGV
jgi:hypothetical protein